MGNAASAIEESFEDDLLEYPLYTRPAEWNGEKVPDVLLSGHHANINAWRQAQRERGLQRHADRTCGRVKPWRVTSPQDPTKQPPIS